ncbi:Dabb family protein [Pseudonocardia nematodicida]|uniref:Dabb family protein n=1 Tax=Pseudonocardia nematodicida TaxID=1206997 RepID=A0ABV1KFR1_9PSEU
MMRHVVLRAFKDGVTQEQISELEERTRALVAIDGVRSVVTGPNLDLVPRSDGFQHVTLIDMDGPDTLPAFIADPVHRATAELSARLVGRSVILDLAVD